MLLGLAETAEVLAARERQDQHLVRLVASIAACHGLLVGALSEFGKLRPNIAVHLTEAEGDDQLLAISRGEADFVACRRPAAIPEGWHFVPLVDDRFAVLCSAGHPLERIRRPSAELLAKQTWLLFPSGTLARERFDELAQSFPEPPRTHAVITRSPTMMWWLLRHEELLSFMAVNFARPMLEGGELREVAMAPTRPLEPLGLLRPTGPLPHAAEQLSEYLQGRSSWKLHPTRRRARVN
jgi:DNA-binding transcriptional LysR family regulator